MNKPTALQHQEGGSHYSKLAIQTMEFSMANNWDPCAHTILKYVTRYRDKNGLQDLNKAKHCIALRQELWHAGHKPADVIDPAHYCHENRLGPYETSVIIALAQWVWFNTERYRLQLVVALDLLTYQNYGLPSERKDPFCSLSISSD